MILLDSLYINNSGGKVLLDYLIEKLHESKSEVFYLLDERCKGSYPFLSADRTLYCKASLANRSKYYKANKKKFNTVLCFANLPPSIGMEAKVYTYFHNLLLIDQPKNYPLKGKIKFFLKGLFIKMNKHNTDYFIVQSDNVKKNLLKFLNIEVARCLTIPFYRHLQTINQFSKKNEGFVYISNGNSHKNHLTLFKAWIILFEKYKITPELHLTITEDYPELLSLIKEYESRGLKVINHGRVNVQELYSNFKYAIYPSLTESFGLGLIEAIETQTEIIAADLPYVNAIVDPLLKFNPNSDESIAEAVLIALKNNNPLEFKSKSKISDEIEKLIIILSE